MILGTVALALALQPSPPQPEVDVVWRGPSGCVDVERFRALVLELSGPSAVPVMLSASSVGDDWRVEVTYEDIPRVVESDDCALLTEAVALIVAVRIDPIRTAVQVEPMRTPEPTRTAEPAPEPTPEAEPKPEPSPAPVSRSPERARRQPPGLLPTAVIGAAGSLGTLPRGGVALRADVGLRRNALEIDIGAVVTLGPESRATRGVASDFRMFGGLAQACWILESGAVAVPLCGRAEIGVIQGRPRGLENPKDVDALWAAPALRAALAPSRGRFAPEGFLEVAAPVRRHRFESADAGRLHRLPPVVLRLGIALRWRGLG